MLPFVPRSVAGTKRRHPLGGTRVPPTPAAEEHVASPDAAAERIADGLLPLLPQLADSFPGATHVMRVLAHPAVVPLARASADLLAAFRTLAPLGGVAVDGFHVTLAAPAHAVFCQGIPHRGALDAARFLAALTGGRVFAVYAPTADGAPDLARRDFRNAFALVDERAATELLSRWAWDAAWASRDGALRNAAPLVVDAVLAQLRCMPRDTWLARRDEYRARQSELVARNAAAARAAAAAHREADAQDEGIPAVFLAVPIAHAATQPAYKSVLARHVPNAVDYVDVRASESRIYIRCASVHGARQLHRAIGPDAATGIRGPASLLGGDALRAYWEQLPERVRNATMRRARTG